MFLNPACEDFWALPSIQGRRGDLGWSSFSVDQSFSISSHWDLPGQLLLFTAGECCAMVSLPGTLCARARGSNAHQALRLVSVGFLIPFWIYQ